MRIIVRPPLTTSKVGATMKRSGRGGFKKQFSTCLRCRCRWCCRCYYRAHDVSAARQVSWDTPQITSVLRLDTCTLLWYFQLIHTIWWLFVDLCPNDVLTLISRALPQFINVKCSCRRTRVKSVKCLRLVFTGCDLFIRLRPQVSNKMHFHSFMCSFHFF